MDINDNDNNNNDVINLINDDDDVLARARHYNGHVVNLTAPRIQEMKRAIQSAMALAGVPTGPMFPADNVLSVTLVLVRWLILLVAIA
jgi:hypothetical protein